MPGPLTGLRVVELAGIGPGPHAAMLLADLGADVVRVERPSGGLQVLAPGARDWLLRGRRSVAANLKDPAGRSTTPTPAPTGAMWPSAPWNRSSTPNCWRDSAWPARTCRRRWTATVGQCCARFTEVFATRTRDEWVKIFADTDACVTPVLSFAEVPEHPHLVARNTLVHIDGVLQAVPAPRFSRTVPDRPAAPPTPGADTEAVLRDWGVSTDGQAGPHESEGPTHPEKFDKWRKR